MLSMPFDLYLEGENTLCECGHWNTQHELLFSKSRQSTLPCGADDHFDVVDGKMVLVKEPCKCRNYVEG